MQTLQALLKLMHNRIVKSQLPVLGGRVCNDVCTCKIIARDNRVGISAPIAQSACLFIKETTHKILFFFHVHILFLYCKYWFFNIVFIGYFFFSLRKFSVLCFPSPFNISIQILAGRILQFFFLITNFILFERSPLRRYFLTNCTDSKIQSQFSHDIIAKIHFKRHTLFLPRTITINSYIFKARNCTKRILFLAKWRRGARNAGKVGKRTRVRIRYVEKATTGEFTRCSTSDPVRSCLSPSNEKRRHRAVLFPICKFRYRPRWPEKKKERKKTKRKEKKGRKEAVAGFCGTADDRYSS